MLGQWMMLRPVHRINRNILECKESRRNCKNTDGSVLIETYWNVKVSCTTRNLRPQCGINRNILECKVYNSFKIYHLEIVLIETYWNVKGIEKELSERMESVLIETYWNVKAVSQMISGM